MLRKLAFQPETRFFMLNVLCIRSVKIAFGETQVIDSIDQICLANAIFSANANYPLVKYES